MKNKEIKQACRPDSQSEVRAADVYPGVAINDSDKNKVNDALVKERTRTLNNNPRNDR